MGKTVYLDGKNVKIHEVWEVSTSFDGSVRVEIPKDVLEKLEKTREILDEILDSGKIIYGVNTGFGSLQSEIIKPKDRLRLQRELIYSHSTQVDAETPKEIVKAMMVIRLNNLLNTSSGVRAQVINLLKGMVNENVIPVFGLRGSLGASGDLAPLAHMAKVLMKSEDHEREEKIKNLIKDGKALSGEDKNWASKVSGLVDVLIDGKFERMTGIEGMVKKGLERVELREKEGLALINGTSFSTALLLINLMRAKKIFDWSIKISALTFEVLKGVSKEFSEGLISLRPHRGQTYVAKRLLEELKGSNLANSSQNRGLQDPYSLRCIPQVVGPLYETIEFCEEILQTEINSVTDNPLLVFEFGTHEILSGGNFHAQYIGVCLDYLSIALTICQGISERRINLLMDKNFNKGLPPFLAEDWGVQSGLMVAHYTAASLLSESKSLCYPHSVDSIPTSANQEDYVSMAPGAGLRLMRIVKNAEYILSIEALCALRAFHMRMKKEGIRLEDMGEGTRKTFIDLSKIIPSPLEDIEFSEKIETLRLNLFQNQNLQGF